MEETNHPGKALLAIESGHIKMRPRWQFLVRSILLIIGTFIVLLAILFLASFILFILRQSGLWFAPGFGLSGFGIFIRSLPWILVVLAALFIIALELLVRKYSFGYGRPLIYTLFGIIFIAIIGGIILEMTSFQRTLFVSARNNQLPFGGGFYRSFGAGSPDQNLLAGNIAAVSSTIFLILTPRDEQVPLVIDQNTKFISGNLNDLEVGDAIVAEVQSADGQIRAISILKILDEMHFPRMRHPMMRPMMFLLRPLPFN